ncbi:MAG TPA: penicillin-binding transpeptidase domain-containing protein [Patescibacteria group bacterium]
MDKHNTISILGVILVFLMALAVSRAVFLTVFMGGHFNDLAKDNMVKRIVLEPVRGVINDNKGKPLAMNIDYQGKTVRFYPLGEVSAAIVGYMGKMSDTDLKNCGDNCYPDSLLGKAGLEKQYQDKLNGVPGEELVEETANGNVKSTLSRTEPVNGENITTNIDSDLQKKLTTALANAYVNTGKSGIAVVAKVSGEVLSLVSLPSYDPNLFVPDGKRSDYGGTYKSVADLIKDEDKKPLFDRAISGDYAPGSVYKLTPAIAALEEGKIDKNTLINDTGEIKIGDYRFGNWYMDEYGRTEGEINVVKAIARSNDIFFYKVGEALGVDKLVSWSKRLGLGSLTGIDLPGESDGFVSTPYWREKTTGAKWFLGNTYHMSIGQGDLMATPVQINRMTAAVISGLKCSPRLVGRSTCEDVKTSEANREIILEGMKGACSKGGTAFPLFDYEGQIYCKTGTAQHGGETTQPQAWVSVVVPKGNNIKDWLVVTVLIEAGGEGSKVAAPVVAEVMPYLLSM